MLSKALSRASMLKNGGKSSNFLTKLSKTTFFHKPQPIILTHSS